MTQAYRITLHAQERIAQRRFTVEELLAALNGRRVQLENGLVALRDPISRCVLVIDPVKATVVTVLRLKRGKYRKSFAGETKREGV